VVFQVDGGEIAAIGLVENGDDPVSFLGTDAFSPCGVA